MVSGFRVACCKKPQCQFWPQVLCHKKVTMASVYMVPVYLVTTTRPDELAQPLGLTISVRHKRSLSYLIWLPLVIVNNLNVQVFERFSLFKRHHLFDGFVILLRLCSSVNCFDPVGKNSVTRPAGNQQQWGHKQKERWLDLTRNRKRETYIRW